MNENVRTEKLINEEIKQVKFFLWLFYILLFGYGLLIHYVQPYFLDMANELPKDVLGQWYYLFMLLPLPFVNYLIKKRKPYAIKYIFVIFYTFLDIINMLLTFWGSEEPLRYGNITDVLFLLFAPIFVNKKYFWVVSIGTIGKFVFSGIILYDKNTIIPIAVYMVISIIALFILLRYMSYVKTITAVYEELRQKEKFAYIGQMASSIGHEIRNPLSALKGFTQLQQERDTQENNYYPIMIQEIDRINSIVEDLMVLGKPKSPNIKPNDLREILEYVKVVSNQLAEINGSEIVINLSDDFPMIDCDEKQMKQVFINIFKNAIESMETGGRIEVSFSLSKKNRLTVFIQDQGSGIEKETLKMLGEPFYTTKPNGTGLGLLVTKKIIENHEGDIQFESQPGKGTTVEITLPFKQNIN